MCIDTLSCRKNISSHIATCFIIFLVAVYIYLPSSPDLWLSVPCIFIFCLNCSCHNISCILYKKCQGLKEFLSGINQFCLFVMNRIFFFSLCFQCYSLLMYILLLICFSYFKINLWKEFLIHKCYLLLSCIGFISTPMLLLLRIKSRSSGRVAKHCINVLCPQPSPLWRT